MLKKAAAALVAALGAASCSTGGPATAVKHRTYVYTCCVASDINRPLHPGQTLTVRWIVKPGPLSAQPKAAKITLEASLTGPYQTVVSLKQDLAGPKAASLGRDKATLAAGPVRTTDWVRSHPVMKIVIPGAAGLGFYNLKVSVVSAGGSSSGASIVRVTARG